MALTVDEAAIQTAFRTFSPGAIVSRAGQQTNQLTVSATTPDISFVIDLGSYYDQIRAAIPDVAGHVIREDWAGALAAGGDALARLLDDVLNGKTAQREIAPQFTVSVVGPPGVTRGFSCQLTHSVHASKVPVDPFTYLVAPPSPQMSWNGERGTFSRDPEDIAKERNATVSIVSECVFLSDANDLPYRQNVNFGVELAPLGGVLDALKAAASHHHAEVRVTSTEIIFRELPVEEVQHQLDRRKKHAAKKKTMEQVAMAYDLLKAQTLTSLEYLLADEPPIVSVAVAKELPAKELPAKKGHGTDG